MDAGDRTMAAAVVGICWMLIVLGTVQFVSWEKPYAIIFLVPGTIITWIALWNIAERR